MGAFESIRIVFAFSAGAATFFAPCAYPLLPGYIAYYLGQSEEEMPPTRTPIKQAAVVGSVTSVGFFLVYVALAGIVVTIGTQALSNISVIELVVGGLLIVLGVGMAAGKLNPDRLHIRFPERDRSPTGFLLFGIVYALAAAGCTAPVFIGIAAFALSGGPVSAAITLGAYALGMSVLMITVTVVSALGRQQVLRVMSENTARLARAAGVLLIVAGVTQIYLFLFEFDGFRILGLA